MAKEKHQQLQRFNILALIVFFVSVFLALSVSFYALILVIMSMLPTLTAWMVDKGSGKNATRIIAAFNYCGILPSLITLWESRVNSSLAKHMIADPMIWLVSYGAAAIGWGMVLIIPQFISYVFAARAELKIAYLKGQQQKLVEEWGQDVKH